MMFMPYYFFFFMMLIVGTFMSISSSSWLYIWMGLEINLISFIPLIMCSGVDMETESSLKYFLVQALGSGLLLMGSLVCMNYHNSMISYFGSIYILICSLLIKLGVAPFHFWLPHVMGGISWISCLLLAVWQKVGPFFILSMFMFFDNLFIFLVSGLSAVVGGIGGINQSQIRVLLAYSSIGHMGWMSMAIVLSFSFFFIYFVIYSLINMGLMLVMNLYNVKGVGILGLGGLSFMHSMIIMFMFLSLAGLPPFLGFYGKWMVLLNLINYNFFFVSFFMILGSLMNIYYYFNVFFNIVLNSFFFEINNYMLKSNYFSNYVIFILFIISSLTLGLFYIFIM